MKTVKATLIAITLIIIASCSSTKKSSTSTTFSAPTPASVIPLVSAKPADGINIPGDVELTAIQAKYKDVTLDQLKEGHTIYAVGACINCHGAQNIYQFGEAQWKDIIDDMAQRANISNVQKDAVYKYVLAIKAVQPK